MKAIAITLVALAGCDRVEGMAGGARGWFSAEAAPPERSVGAPAELDVSGPVVWDGQPSLGGVWVAHPDVDNPVRVRIAAEGSGASAEGWLFRREPPQEGPALQVSSEGAEALGLAANEQAMLVIGPIPDDQPDPDE